MVPQPTMFFYLHMQPRMLLVCLSSGLLLVGWLIAQNEDKGVTTGEHAHQGIVCPTFAGPEPIQTQPADRFESGGSSASLSNAMLRGGGSVVARVTVFLTDSVCRSSARPVTIPMAQLPWVLTWSVCLQV
jgi:hypothetical protein